jgi:hypothetical protein
MAHRDPARYRAADMAQDRLHRILAELSAVDGAWPVARLCAAGPRILGVNGAGIMLMSGDIPRGSLGTTDEVSQLIEDLQYTLGEGPCVDAYQQDEVVAEPDLARPAGGSPSPRRYYGRARGRYSRSRCGSARYAWEHWISTATGPAR